MWLPCTALPWATPILRVSLKGALSYTSPSVRNFPGFSSRKHRGSKARSDSLPSDHTSTAKRSRAKKPRASEGHTDWGGHAAATALACTSRPERPQAQSTWSGLVPLHLYSLPRHLRPCQAHLEHFRACDAHPCLSARRVSPCWVGKRVSNHCRYVEQKRAPHKTAMVPHSHRDTAWVQKRSSVTADVTGPTALGAKARWTQPCNCGPRGCCGHRPILRTSAEILSFATTAWRQQEQLQPHVGQWGG